MEQKPEQEEKNPPPAGYVDPFWDGQEELLGLLLSLEQRLSAAGGNTLLLFFAAYLLFAFAIYSGTGEQWLPALPWEALHSWLGYTVALVPFLAVGFLFASLQERVAYRMNRGPLRQALSKRALTRHVVIVKIARSPGLKLPTLLKWLEWEGD